MAFANLDDTAKVRYGMLYAFWHFRSNAEQLCFGTIEAFMYYALEARE